MAICDIINRMDNTVGRLQTIFPPHQFDVIIGSLLGDARLECRSKGKRYPVSARLRTHQGDKQKDYVFWKYEVLKNLVSEGPRRVKTWHDPKRNKDHYSWYFHTKTLIELGNIYHHFYHEGRKILPKDIFEFLSHRALAIWFMDDGSNTKESYTISTHNFLFEEQQRIIEFLQKQYNISATIVKDRSKFKIRIGGHDYQKLTEIIEPHIIPSMIYKICNPRNDLFVKNEQIQQASLVA